jgi:hypothetical protein
MAILLANEEDLDTPGLDMFIDIDAPCPMFSGALRLFDPHTQLRGSTETLDGAVVGNQGGSIGI